MKKLKLLNSDVSKDSKTYYYEYKSYGIRVFIFDSGVISLTAQSPKTYYQDIYFSNGLNKNAELVVGTTSYGSLNLEEFNELLEAQKETLELINLINIEIIKR